MKKLVLDLVNCHGIRKLTSALSFADSNAVAVYAPNGMMKTSFARTFLDLARNVESTDHMFPDRPSQRTVADETGSPLLPDDVVVIVSYDEEMGPTEATSTLLVDKALRSEYQTLQVGINAAKTELTTALKVQGGKSKKDVERTVSTVFTRDAESFFTALQRIEGEIATDSAEFADVPYDIVFDDKVVALLQTDDFREKLTDYVTRFNDLLDSSDYFSKDKFNYYNASNVTKSLGDNGFFAANHAVKLQSETGSEEITTAAQLKKLIDDEKQRISEDDALRKTFADLESQLNRNVEARRFYDYIQNHLELLPELQNIDRFNERVWKSYIKANEGLYANLLEVYRAAEARRREIEETAATQRSEWEEVIDIFNDRFFVPFTLTIKNRARVVLGQEPIPLLGFDFKDGADYASVERDDLLRVLSTGEKKALYVLNVLFEVQRRKSSDDDTLFIVDDIADSFDYKNKYAIIQYLKDIAEFDKFRLVMLTHNFDFFRTLESRFVPYKQCFMASRNDEGIELTRAVGIRNPFINDFKPHFFDDGMKRLASIPFMRNLIEYTRGEANDGFRKLTSLLHEKSDTATVTQADLDVMFADLFGGTAAWTDASQLVRTALLEAAEACVDADDSINFENKIILSMAIRLIAEQYMVAKINDPAFVGAITSNQTGRLFDRFRLDSSTESDQLRVLERVVLMTPEHIHINSFMYEPILDMSDEHLRKLLREVKALV